MIRSPWRPGFRLILLAAAAILGQAADCDTETTAPDPFSGTIRGMVTANGEPLPGVRVDLSDEESTITDPDGQYTFTGVSQGSYAISISGYPVDVTFPATTQAVTVVQDVEPVIVDFIGVRILVGAVVGTVTLDGAPAQGVVVTLEGEDTRTTNAQGDYSFSGLDPGSYTVAVTPPGDAECDPAERTVEVVAAGSVDADFACVTPQDPGDPGDQTPTAQAIGDLEVRIDGAKTADSCPDGTVGDDIDDEGPFPVADEDRDGVPFVVLVLDATLEGEYDPQTGEWVGVGNVLSGDETIRLRESADGVWSFDDGGAIVFEGTLSFEFFDTNGTPQDFGDDVKICEATFDVTLSAAD